MSEGFRQLSEVVGSASAVLSTKRTVEVIPERLAVVEERKSGSSSPEVISGVVRGVPLQVVVVMQRVCRGWWNQEMEERKWEQLPGAVEVLQFSSSSSCP
jgi:hypothetical protein